MNRLKGKRTYIKRKSKSAPRPTKRFVRRNTAPLSLNQLARERRILEYNLRNYPDNAFAAVQAMRMDQGKARAPYASGWARRVKVPKGVKRIPKSSYSVHSNRFNGPKLLSKLQAAIRGRQQRQYYKKFQKSRLKKSFNRRFNPGY